MSHEPHATASALWVRAWLAGDASTDATVGALAATLPDSTPVQLLAEIRDAGADRAWLLLPRPGAIVGWPREVPRAPEPAVLLSRGEIARGLIPAASGRQRLVPLAPDTRVGLAGVAISPRAAGRALAELVLDAARGLETLDLARPARHSGASRWATALTPSPPGTPPAVADTVDRAAVVLDALELALADDGAACTAAEAAARASRLRALRDGVQDLLVALVAGLAAGSLAEQRAAAASLR